MINFLALDTSNSIDLLDLLKLFQELEGNINTLWNFFAVVVIALLGYVYKDEAMREDWRTKLGLSIGFVVFAAMNQYALYGAFGMADQLKEVIHARAAYAPEFKGLIDAHYVSSLRGLNVFHTTLIIMVLAAIWIPNIVKWRSGTSAGSNA